MNKAIYASIYSFNKYLLSSAILTIVCFYFYVYMESYLKCGIIKCIYLKICKRSAHKTVHTKTP